LITGIKILNENLKTTATFLISGISHCIMMISRFIEFAALNYVRPEKNSYAYQLVGFDKDWQYSGERNFADYTNLNAGTYVFRVKAATMMGVE